ncbi:MAG: hypothetical protein RL026_2525, partial [Pseudomonadota bacterium]
MELPYFLVDAFSARPFGGNPAGVCVLDADLPAEVMQAVAAEINLSETAFLRRGAGVRSLRWFTPATEVDLCGHATLAAAHVLVQHFGAAEPVLRFATASGELGVSRDGQRLVLDFPARPAEPCEPPPALLSGLGLNADTPPVWVGRSRDYLVVLGSADAVVRLRPDMRLLATLDSFGVIVTAPGEGDADFVSRFFAPGAGVPEDPVTGSAHCTLLPWWSRRLGRTRLLARQVSARGGWVHGEDCGDRVRIGGDAVTVMR